MNKTMILAAVLATAGMTGLSACDKKAEAAVKVDKAAISTAIKDDVHGLMEAFNAKDAAKAVTHDAPTIVGMFHGAPNVVGPEQDLAMTKEQVKDPLGWLTVGNETVDVADSGEMAVYRTSYAYRMTDPRTKKEAKELGNWVIGYQKQADGKWKIAWNVVSDTGAPPTVAKAK